MGILDKIIYGKYTMLFIRAAVFIGFVRFGGLDSTTAFFVWIFCETYEGRR